MLSTLRTGGSGVFRTLLTPLLTPTLTLALMISTRAVAGPARVQRESNPNPNPLFRIDVS